MADQLTLYPAPVDSTVKLKITSRGRILESPTCNAKHYRKNRKNSQALRKHSIGGSDAPALANGSRKLQKLCGINLFTYYGSPFTVYMQKIEGLRQAETLAMARGNRREEGLRKLAGPLIAKAEGLDEVRAYVSNYTYYSVPFNCLSANLDGLIAHPNYGVCGLEIKTTTNFNKKDFLNNSVPAYYYVQCQHYMAVCGLDKFYLLAEVGDELILRLIERNDAFIELLLKEELKFYQEVILGGNKPEPLGIKGEEQYFNTVKQTKEALKEASASAQKWVTDLAVLKEAQERVAMKIKQIELALKEEIGGDAGIEGDGFTVTHKTQSTQRIDTKRLKEEEPELYEYYLKETTSRVLRIK